MMLNHLWTPAAAGFFFCLLPFRVAIAGGGGPAKSVAPVQPFGWQWSGSFGVGYRHLGGIEFNSRPFSSASLLPALQPRISQGLPGGIDDLTIGSPTVFADRTYMNGFVNIDGETANPNSFLPGTTGFWGYQTDSQVQGGNLRFAGGNYATSVEETDSTGQPNQWGGNMDGLTPILELQALYALRPELRAGGTLTFMFSRFHAGNRAVTFRSTHALKETVFSVTDVYNLQGVIPPSAPYAGVLNNPGTAPLINNIPSQRIISEVASNTQTAVYENSSVESMKLSLSTLSLGPTFEYSRGNFSFSGSLGVALNFANWNASTQEQLYQSTNGGTPAQIREWRERSSGSDVLPGFFITAAGSHQIGDQCELSIFGRYDWSRELSGTVGPSSFRADPGGYSVGGTVTFRF